MGQGYIELTNKIYGNVNNDEGSLLAKHHEM